MQAAVATSLEHVMARFLHDGTHTRRGGRLHWTRCFQLVRARDGWVAATTLGDWTTFERIRRLLADVRMSFAPAQSK